MGLVGICHEDSDVLVVRNLMVGCQEYHGGLSGVSWWVVRSIMGELSGVSCWVVLICVLTVQRLMALV